MIFARTLRPGNYTHQESGEPGVTCLDDTTEKSGWAWRVLYRQFIKELNSALGWHNHISLSDNHIFALPKSGNGFLLGVKGQARQPRLVTGIGFRKMWRSKTVFSQLS